MMQSPEKNEDGWFSLLGGPLYRMGCYTGLIRNESNSVPLGLAIATFLWGVLVLLALIQGHADQLFTLSLINVHVYLLVVIPLLFLSETLLDPRCGDFVNSLVRSEIVPESAQPALEAIILRIHRKIDAWLPEVILFGVAIAISIVHPKTPLLGASVSNDAPLIVSDLSLASYWYWTVCMTLFRFLVLRWLWRIGLWAYFLWLVSRLPLHLVPTHPDGFAGLGYLEAVHINFIPSVLAISVVQCSAFADAFIRGNMPFDAIYGVYLIILLVDAFLFLGPLFFFSPMLWTCKINGLRDYMDFASRYVGEFERKWIMSGEEKDEPLLGTADLQSLADLGNSVDVIREMGWVPISKRLMFGFITAALLPLLPLALFKYSSYELIIKLFEELFGI